MKNFKRDSRGFVIHNFRNIGVYNNNSSEKDKEGAFLRLSSLESPGGLVIVLGENNTGKSNALAALEEFGKGEKGNLHNNKPNFLDYEDSLPQLELSYRIYGQQESEHENINNFEGKTFNITFTDNSKAKGMEIEGLDEEAYKTLIQEKIDNAKVFVLYDIDINRQKPQKEIRLILPESNRVLFCSPTLGGKSLQCFSTVEKDYKSVKNLNKAIPLSCRFMVEDVSQTNDDAKELREYLKELYGDKNNRHSQTLSYEFYKAISCVDDKEETCRKYFPNETKQERDMEAIHNEVVSKYQLIKDNGVDRHYGGISNEYYLNKLEKHQNDFETLKKLYSDLENMYKDSLRYYSYPPKIDFIDLDSIPLRTYSMAPDIDLGDIDFIPNIVLYKGTPLGNEDLVTTPIDISDSNFFQSLFKAIDCNPKTIKNAYDQYKEKSSTAHYTSAARDITKKLKHINQRFNDLYNKDSEFYRFELHCENNQISLEIYKNDQALNLDEQSVGFRKFFDFFFNFLHTGKVGKGDIVLIDEAETHLSVPAQRDFRAFLKDFGQKHGYFVCSYDTFAFYA